MGYFNREEQRRLLHNVAYENYIDGKKALIVNGGLSIGTTMPNDIKPGVYVYEGGVGIGTYASGHGLTVLDQGIGVGTTAPARGLSVQDGGIGVGAEAPTSGILMHHGNLDMNNNWLNSGGQDGFGLRFSPLGRVSINDIPSDADGVQTPLLDVQANAATFGHSTPDPSTVIFRIGPDVVQAAKATARINGSLSVGTTAAFGGYIKAYRGITVGTAHLDNVNNVGVGCTSSLYGTLSFECTNSTPTTCSLMVCIPCNGAAAPHPCGGISGDRWAPFITSTAPAGGGPGGIGPITSEPEIDL